MSRSCTYAGKYTAEDSSVELYGIFEREEQLDDLRAVRRYEIQV